MGKYDEKTRRFDPTGSTALQYNYGSANAGKGFTHVQSGRRLLWQWLDPAGGSSYGSGGCRVTDTDVGASGVVFCNASKHAWDGVMSVPQEVRWDPGSARLIILPVSEVDQLHTNLLMDIATAFQHEVPLQTSVAVSMAHVDVVAQFRPTCAHKHACTVGVRLFGCIEIGLDLLANSMNVTSPTLNVTAKLPPQQAAGRKVVDLRILVDGEQFEIFGLGGRANVALRARPLQHGAPTRTLGTAFEDGDGLAELSVRTYAMETAYEDDDDRGGKN